MTAGKHWKPTAAERVAEPVRRVVLLGSTGSVGTQTLDVIDHLNALHASGRHPLRYDVVGLACGRNASLLAGQARRFGCRPTCRPPPGESPRARRADGFCRRDRAGPKSDRPSAGAE
jgi:hypothetical protein